MKRTFVTPFLLIALTACATTDGTPLATTEAQSSAVPVATTIDTTAATTVSAPTYAPTTVVPTTPIYTTPRSPVAVSTVPVTPAQVVDPTQGQIVLVEPVKPISQRGGSAVVAIGATILGAFIPGPWGSIASVATGQAGQLAMNNIETKSARYHVRMADGTVQTITQSDPLMLAVGTPVQVLTLADGSSRLVQTNLAVPATATPL